MRTAAISTAAFVAIALATLAVPAGAVTVVAPKGPVVLLDERDAVVGAVLDMSQSGSAIAAWMRYDGNTSLWRIEAALSTAPSDWGTRVRLGENEVHAIERPHVAIDDAGYAAAAWWEESPTSGYGQIYHPASGWLAPTRLQNASTSLFPTVVSTGNGTFAFAWIEGVGGNAVGFLNTWDPSDGWGIPMEFTPLGENASEVSIAGDPSGNVTVTWQNSDLLVAPILYGRTFGPNAGWGPIEIVGEIYPAGYFNSVCTDQAEDGTFVAAWVEADMSTGTGPATARVRTPAGAWMDPVPATVFYSYSSAVGCAALGGGDAAVSYVRDGGSLTVAGVSILVGGARPTTTTALDSFVRPPIATAPSLDSSSSGHVTAAWAHSWWPENDLRAASYAAGRGWTSPVVIFADRDATGGAPSVGEDARGGAAAAWLGIDSRVRAVNMEPAPSVAITAPAANSTIGALSARLVVQGDPGLTLSGPWGSGITDSTGAFQAVVALAPGANTITVTATDGDNRSASVSVEVFAVDPTSPALEQALIDLNQTRAAMDELNDTLNVTTAVLDQVRGDLDALVPVVDELNDSLGDASAEIQRLKAQDAASNVTIANLSAESQRLSLELGQAQIQAAAAAEVARKAQEEANHLAAGSSMATMFALGGIALGAVAAALAVMLSRRGRPTATDPYPDPKDAK